MQQQKIRIGSVVWVNLEKRNPVKYSNSVSARVTKILGKKEFFSKTHGKATLVKIAFHSKQTRQRIGYLEEVRIY